MARSTPRIYLDYNASAPLRPAAKRAMWSSLDAFHGNASSVHGEGRRARAALEAAREQVAAAMGASPNELILTGSATEANNLALKGAAIGPRSRERHVLITSTDAHPSVLAPAEWLGNAPSETLHLQVPVDGHGHVDDEALDDALDHDTLLVSILAANNETGVLAPVAAIAKRVHACGGLLHVDAAQAFGRIPVDVGAWDADLVTLSSHKMGGPVGAGALWVRPGVQITPLHHGGHQERNRRGGSEDVLAHTGFGAACAEVGEHLDEEQARVVELRDSMWHFIQDKVPNVLWLGDPEACLPGTLCAALPGVDGEALMMALDLAGVAASVGSACTAGSLDPSHVLLAMGVDESLARSAVRFSLGYATTSSEVEMAAGLLAELAVTTRRPT